MKQILEKNYKIIIFSALAFMLVVSALNAKNESAIFDETAHIPASYSYLSQHDMRLNPEHPPLIKDLAGMPLLFLDLNFDTAKDYWATDVNGQWKAGTDFLYHSGNDPDQIISWSRVPIILLSLLLGFFVFKWTNEMAGKIAGIFALVLLAFDPNILGHNHFVTTDIGIAVFLTLAFYYYLKFIKDPSWKNILVAGIFLGLLQLAKFSSIVAFPILGLATLVYPLVKINRKKISSNLVFKIKKLGEYVGKAAVVTAVSLVVVWIVYFFNTYEMPKEKLVETINYYFNAGNTWNPKEVYTNKILNALNENAVLRPMSEYCLGIAMVFKRVFGGNGAYFMGQVSSQAFPSYFPVVFLIKEPLPALLFMLFALCFAIFKSVRTFARTSGNFFLRIFRNTAHYLRTNISEVAMFSFVALYSYVSVTGNLNIGFRHLFPILPFIYILTAKNIFAFLERKEISHAGNNNATLEKSINTSKPSRPIASFVITFLAAFLIIGTVAAYPNYMSYFNELAGGPKNGYRYVTDSNADWGQDLERLKKFLAAHPEIEKIRVDYFGGGDIYYYIGEEKSILWWDSKRPVEAGWYAISTNFLQGSIYDKAKPNEKSYRWLKNKKPDYQVGTSILIYNISEKEALAANTNI